jgi:DNA-directed RNA polymerase specialized sigma24 family protein
LSCENLNALDDGELIREWREGDHAAMSILHARHDLHLRNFLRRFCHDEDRARDAAQEAWLAIVNGSIKEEGNFFGLLCKIGRNKLIQRWRDLKAEREAIPTLIVIGMQDDERKQCVFCRRSPDGKSPLCSIHRWRWRNGFTLDQMSWPVGKRHRPRRKT